MSKSFAMSLSHIPALSLSLQKFLQSPMEVLHSPQNLPRSTSLDSLSDFLSLMRPTLYSAPCLAHVY